MSLVRDVIGQISEDEFHIRRYSANRMPGMYADEPVKEDQEMAAHVKAHPPRT